MSTAVVKPSKEESQRIANNFLILVSRDIRKPANSQPQNIVVAQYLARLYGEAVTMDDRAIKEALA